MTPTKASATKAVTVQAPGGTGALRLAIHKRLYVVFLPVYAIVLLTAVLGYRP